MEFQDGTSTNDKMNELMRLYPIEYGWYSAKALDGLDTVIPHVFDRPTTAAYMLRLADCPSLPRLEQALLDELTSGTVVYYRSTSGARLRLELADEDPSHPLVRSGYARWGVVDISDTQDDPVTVGTLANAENGRARIKGDVTTDKLLTINGAPADVARVRCGEMCYVIELGITARIERVEWQGRYVTLTLDSAGYRLDAYLANLAAKR